MKNTDKIYALITGASKGLGKSYAIELAKRKHNVLLLSCENEGLGELCKLIQQDYGVEADYFETDLTQLNEIDRLVKWVNKNYNINILINNAGLGGSCQFEKSSLSFIDNMIKLNIRALSMLTHQFLPMLKLHDEAYILNVSSMASFSPVGYKSVYPASKRFVQDFSLGLGAELNGSSVSVSVVHPGPMRTNKFLLERIKKHGPLLKAGVIPTEIVASTSLDKLFNHKKVIIVGWANYLMWFLMTSIPNRFSMPLMTNAIRNEIEMTFTATEVS
jgi:short-subunit dehydrogenase